MGDYIIRIDSSTKHSKMFVTDISGKHAFDIKSGRSTAAWITQRGGGVIAAGLIYYGHNGPNKTIYEGILAALSQLETDHFYAGGTDTVKIFADCEIVIDQLNDSAVAIRMGKHLARVKSFCAKHPNVKFEFIYQNEKDPEYKKVDIISKVGRDWLLRMIKDSKKPSKSLKLKPKEIIKKPYYAGNPMIWSEVRKKWYVITKNGEWLEFDKGEKSIDWRIVE